MQFVHTRKVTAAMYLSDYKKLQQQCIYQTKEERARCKQKERGVMRTETGSGTESVSQGRMKGNETERERGERERKSKREGDRRCRHKQR